MHPLLALLASRPQLLVDHAQAYAALFSEEFALAYAAWQRRVMLRAIALFSLTVAAVLAGVAAMLWVTLMVSASAMWVLVVIFLLPLLVGVICLLLVLQAADADPFANLRRQINADMAMLRAAGAADMADAP